MACILCPEQINLSCCDEYVMFSAFYHPFHCVFRVSQVGVIIYILIRADTDQDPATGSERPPKMVPDMGWVSGPRVDTCHSEATTGSEYKCSRDGVTCYLTTLVGRKCPGELLGGDG